MYTVGFYYVRFPSIPIASIPLDFHCPDPPSNLLDFHYLDSTRLSSILQTRISQSKMSQVHSHCSTGHNSDVGRVYNTLVNQTTRCNTYLCLKVRRLVLIPRPKCRIPTLTICPVGNLVAVSTKPRHPLTSQFSVPSAPSLFEVSSSYR